MPGHENQSILESITINITSGQFLDPKVLALSLKADLVAFTFEVLHFA